MTKLVTKNGIDVSTICVQCADCHSYFPKKFANRHSCTRKRLGPGGDPATCPRNCPKHSMCSRCLP